MKKKIRMGIIGCGGIATWHIRGITESPDMEVSALCDILPERIKEKMNLCGVQEDSCYSDYRELMASGKADAVSICTPNNLHYEITMEAIRRGLPYAVEKPLCGSEAEAAELAEETAKKKLANMVCFSYRFRAALRYARDIVQSGKLGTLYHISGDYLQSFGMSGDGKISPYAWRYSKKEAFSGALGDLGSHMIDIMRFVTGREFTRIAADMDTFVYKRPAPGGDRTVDVDDYINMIGQMEGKLAADLSISRFAYGRGNHQRVEVYGENGAIRYTLEENDRLEINMGNAPMRDAHLWCAVPVPAIYNANQMQSFADIVNGCGDGLAAGIRDGWKTQQVIDRALAAAESGVRQNI